MLATCLARILGSLGQPGSVARPQNISKQRGASASKEKARCEQLSAKSLYLRISGDNPAGPVG